MKNIIKSLSLLTGAVLATGMLTACDDDKQLTLDAPEARMLESIKIECSETLKLAVGMDSTLVYTYGPTDVTDPKVYFKSSDESIATVDENGTIHAVGVGETTVTALSALGFKVYDAEAVLKVNVIPELIKATRIDLTCETAPSEEGYYYVTDEIQLSAEILPTDHTYDLLKWTSSDESVATVSADGLVTALAEGDVTIKAIAMDKSNASASYSFHFYKLVEAERTEIKPLDGPVCLTYGAFDLDVTYFPAGATIGAVKWESDDETVCKIYRGRVTPVGFGTCNITATCPSTGDIQSVQITVDPGWYIWDASNQWQDWACADTNAPDVKGEKFWHVEFPNPTSKTGRNIKMTKAVDNESTPMVIYPNNYPVLAVRIKRPKGGNTKLDDATIKGINYTRKAELNPKNGIDLGDGTSLLLYNIGPNYTPAQEILKFRVFQFKFTDHEGLDASTAFYDVYWIRTFKSEAEAQAFANAEVQSGN